MTATRHDCWAIDNGEGRFLGILCWFEGAAPTLPAHVQGNRTATWNTRREARNALKQLKAKSYVAWPNAHVARVCVSVEAPHAAAVLINGEPYRYIQKTRAA